MSQFYAWYSCPAPECGFRFPALAGEPKAARCPHCGTPTVVAAEPGWRQQKVPAFSPSSAPQQPVAALLDNIRSTWNVGAMFRTADGAGLAHLHLGGLTPTPDHPKVARTALGAESSVPWTAWRSSLKAGALLRADGYELWALEGGGRAENLFEAQLASAGKKVVLVVGNENAGIDPALLDLCHQVWAIPMRGHKHSLNVAVAFGIAAYHLK